jgi:transglutaminase-like putative cysteine protease
MSNSIGIRRLKKIAGLDTWQQRLEQSTIWQPEDSLLLRILVQLMVSVGIIATDVAANSGDIWMSVWAVPLGAVGAWWSWKRRSQRNIATKFWLAFGMLVALGVFFSQLLRSLNDTRLVLATLLVQLQVLHSFDLPRRKDLGYSMVIGLVLLGVAGTLSQTSAFGGLLLLFLAIALPTLILDYRSRLGLKQEPQRWQMLDSSVSLKQLGVLFLVILALGLVVFASLPRLPGYQLRTFPVSSMIDFAGEFDNSRISNPGYVRQGNPSGESGSGNGVGQGSAPGQVDETFYYGFNNQMNQNLRGFMKPKTVMRVRSQAPGFWQVLSFDRYTGQGWEVSRNDRAITLNRSPWSYQFSLPVFGALGRTQEVVQTYSIVSELPNLIPALATAKRLFFPTRQIAIDPEGSLRSPIILTEDLTYTVISDVAFRDRVQLRQAPTTYPVQIQRYYLEVPAAIAPKLKQLAEQWLAKSEKPLVDPYEKALYLTQYLKQHYQIQPDFPYLKPNQDLAEAFLFQFNGGYPDHFSTTLTLLLRSLGIPARLTAGFAPGQFNPFTGYYVVKNTDAYALTEVYFPGSGWFSFDPIPGHDLFPSSVEESQTFGVLRQFWQWVAGWVPTPVSSLLGNVFGTLLTWLSRVIAWFIGLFTQGWMGILQALLVLVGMSFIGWLSWANWQQWRYRRWLASLPPMERLYRQMLRWLADQGIHKHPAQTPLEFAQHSTHQHPQGLTIQTIAQAYVGWRYGNQAPNLPDLQQRWQQLQRSSRSPLLRSRPTASVFLSTPQ